MKIGSSGSRRVAGAGAQGNEPATGNNRISSGRFNTRRAGRGGGGWSRQLLGARRTAQVAPVRTVFVAAAVKDCDRSRTESALGLGAATVERKMSLCVNEGEEQFQQEEENAELSPDHNGER